MTELDQAGVGVSPGHACAADTPQPGHEHEPAGVVTHGNVRVSLPRAATDRSFELFPATPPGIVVHLRGGAGPGGERMTPPHPAPTAPALTIDALGRKCPIPIIMLAEQINDVALGELIAVLADDPAARTDVPAWCGMKSQEFVVEQPLQRGWAFLVRRCY